METAAEGMGDGVEIATGFVMSFSTSRVCRGVSPFAVNCPSREFEIAGNI